MRTSRLVAHPRPSGLRSPPALRTQFRKKRKDNNQGSRSALLLAGPRAGGQLEARSAALSSGHAAGWYYRWYRAKEILENHRISEAWKYPAVPAKGAS